jgi:hypothetical protein
MSYPFRRARAWPALASAVTIALAAPAAAPAAPSVFTQTAKVVPAGQTPDASWTQASLTDDPQYVVSDNGFTLGLQESNGKLDDGLLTYDVLPLVYRGLFAPTRWLTEGATGAQPHATCDAPALTTSDVVLGWQGSQPGYGYIPFQATSAGLGDDPASWLPSIKAATGLTLTPSSDLPALCARIGGTFVAADTVITRSTSFAAGVAAPLQAKVTELTASLAAAKADLATAKADLAAAKAKGDADVKRLTLEAAPLTVKVPSSATLQRGLEVNVTGPANRRVFVRVQLTEAQRRALKVRYRTLGTGQGTTDAKGKGQVVVQPRPDTAPVLLRQVAAVPTTVVAIAGDRATSLALDLGA